MTNETRCEIIKSLAFGMSVEQVAAAEDVAAAEVEQIAYDDADAVAREREYFRQSGRL